MMRALLTGACGFIGRHCLRPLVERGFEVHAADVAELADDAALHGLATWHPHDLLRDEPGALLRAVRPTHLLHLAWITTPGVYLEAPENRAWAAGSLRLAEAFAESGGRRLVAAGTCFEYEPGAGTCHEATTPLRPASLYARSKVRLHGDLRDLAERVGLSTAWGRVFFLYGPHEKPGRLVPAVIGHLLRGEDAPCSTGTQERDFLHVEDVAAGLVRLLDSDVAGAVNIASAETVTIGDVATTIGDLLGRLDLIRLGAYPTRAGEPERIVAAPGALHRQLGFRPRYDLATGLAATIEWWRAARAEPDRGG